MVQLTTEQKQAIKNRNTHLQLIACAGSGKTEVISLRVADLLDPTNNENIRPENIVAFTFTEKAAGELKGRIAEKIKERGLDIIGLADMFVGTIHGYCLNLLKTEVPEYLKFEVLDEVKQSLLIDRNSTKSGLTKTKDLKGNELKRYQDTKLYIEALSIIREAEINKGKISGCSILKGLEKYKGLINLKRYLDYSSILEIAVEELNKNRLLRRKTRGLIKYVIVDEYQDVNPIQERLIREFAKLGAEICVVGDDDQTIYQWRGSDVSNILDFTKRYQPCSSIRLQENFRSSKGVVETAKSFVEKIPERLDKGMVPTEAQIYEKGDIVALSFENPGDEAFFITNTIRELLGIEVKDTDGELRGLSYSDMAILLRSVRNNSQPIIDALEQAKIPFGVVGMNNLFDRQEIEAARELFYFIADEEGTSKRALVSTWESAGLGIQKNHIKKAVDIVKRERDKMFEEGDEKRFGFYSLQRQYLAFLEYLGISEENVPENRGEVVFYNLGKFSQLISDFETIHYHSDPVRKYKEFASFLRYKAAKYYPEGWLDNQYANLDAVKVMTVHQAKGMQWPVVFIPALLRNRFPSAGERGKTVWHLIPKKAVKRQKRYEGTIDDERRLFYVALTRSQKFLFLTYGPIKGKNNWYVRPSCFWDEVLESKYVSRRPPNINVRKMRTPEMRASVNNLNLSFSDIKYYFECPFQFKLRILYGFNAPIHEALGYGKSLHDILAEIHSRAIAGDIPLFSEVPSIVERHLNVPYAFPSLRDTLRNSAKSVIEKYIKDNEEIFRNIEFSEKVVEIHLGGGITVSGRIDLVRRLDTDITSIVDLKTKEQSQTEEVTEFQLHTYALGYRELTGRDADFLEIYNLDEGQRKPRPIDEDFIADVQANIKKAANALRCGELPAEAGSRTCDRCDFIGLCRSKHN